MAVTVTYSWQVLKSIDLTAGPGIDRADVTALASGGFAAVSDGANSFGQLDIFDSAGTKVGEAEDFVSLGPEIDQLSNGNLVVIGHEDGANQASFAIRSPTGALVLGETLVGGEETFAVDVAALTGGGFVVVLGDQTGPSFIHVEIRNNAGVFLTTFNIANPDEQDYFKPAVAGLDDGGFAIAWEQDNGDIWTAVYNANGTLRRAPEVFDIGVNANVAITATDDGFAIVFEGINLGPNADIGLARFNSAGSILDYVTLSGPPTIDETPQIARMPEGMLAITFGMSLVGVSDSETYLQLYDPATQTVVASRTLTAGQPITDDTDRPTVAGFANGRAAVLHTNVTDGDVDGEMLEVRRQSTGDSANDVIFGNAFLDAMFGRGGDDFMNGLAGNDTLEGEGGNDTLLGGAGNDTLVGGAGLDTASYTSATSSVTVNLAVTTFQNTGGGGVDRITQVENLFGSGFNDSLTGNSGANTLNGGFGGSDVLNGGDGNDRLIGGSGNDSYNGGAGNDTADFSLAFDAIGVNLTLAGPQNTGEGLDTFNGIENLTGSDFADTFTGQNLANRFDGGAGADELRGGSGNDTLNGDGDADLIVGDAGADLIDGGTEIDRLYGGTGNDTIFGAEGADTLIGGPGIDRLDGGAGADRLYADGTADTFVFANADGIGDRIFSFATGIHNLEIDASVFGGAAGGFSFRANANPTPSSGAQWLLYDTDDGKLYFDADGNGAGARIHILTLVGAPTLVSGDIALV